MANHKSAAKRARQTVRKNEVNSRTRSTVRSAEKKLRKAIESKQTDAVQGLLVSYMSEMDKAAQKGVYHKRLASRKVSRLSRQVAAVAQ